MQVPCDFRYAAQSVCNQSCGTKCFMFKLCNLHHIQVLVSALTWMTCNRSLGSVAKLSLRAKKPLGYPLGESAFGLDFGRLINSLQVESLRARCLQVEILSLRAKKPLGYLLGESAFGLDFGRLINSFQVESLRARCLQVEILSLRAKKPPGYPLGEISLRVILRSTYKQLLG